MIFVDKRKLGRPSDVSESNGTAVTLEALHQLAASYFIDRESTLHKLHHIQIASTAIKVNVCCSPGLRKQRSNTHQSSTALNSFSCGELRRYRKLEDTVCYEHETQRIFNKLCLIL